MVAKPYEALINRQMSMATHFSNWVTASEEFELTYPQVLPILNLRVRNRHGSPTQLDASHKFIIEAVHRDGQRWSSSAVVNGRLVIGP